MNPKVTGSYAVAVQRDFIGQHFLTGGDWGPENFKHSHHYKLELQLHGGELDQHGYLVDIVDIEAAMDEVVAYFKDKTLNELPEFAGLNPSIEHLSGIICEKLSKRIKAPNISRLVVKIWENEIAWAAYSRELS